MFTSVYANSGNMRTGYARRAQNRAANRRAGQGSVKKIDYPHPKALEICFKVEFCCGDYRNYEIAKQFEIFTIITVFAYLVLPVNLNRVIIFYCSN